MNQNNSRDGGADKSGKNTIIPATREVREVHPRELYPAQPVFVRSSDLVSSGSTGMFPIVYVVASTRKKLFYWTTIYEID